MKKSQIRSSIVKLLIFLISATYGVSSLYAFNEKGSEDLSIINSKYDEGDVFVTSDGNTMFFTSRKKTNIIERHYGYNNYLKRYIYDSDIYFSEKTERGWGIPTRLGEEINSRCDESILYVTKDGSKMYFLSYRNGFESSGGPIYTAELIDGKWTNIKGLGGHLTAFFDEEWQLYDTPDGRYYCQYINGVTVSPDETEMYFSTDAHRKYGEMDIWVSKKVDGIWSYPENMGNRINFSNAKNTEPFMMYNPNFLYFSSDRGDGTGADLYYTKREKGIWSDPVKMNSFVNSDIDDMKFFIPLDCSKIYYWQETEDGLYDIMSCDLDDSFEIPGITRVKVVAENKRTKEEVSADVQVDNDEYESLVEEFDSGESNGIYLHSGMKYNINASNINYFSSNDILDLSHKIAFDIVEYRAELDPFAVKGDEIEVAVEENSIDNNIMIYPNPTRDQIHINISNLVVKGEIKIKVFGISGELIYDFEPGGNDMIDIDISDRPAGTYLVEIFAGGETYTHKIIKI
jgi:ribosomal protein L24E